MSRLSTTATPWYAANAVAPWATITGMGRRKSRLSDDYTTGSFRDGIVMIVAILAVITLLWLAYGWALGQPGAPAPP
jgi:hypothetical protein